MQPVQVETMTPAQIEVRRVDYADPGDAQALVQLLAQQPRALIFHSSATSVGQQRTHFQFQ